MVEGKALLLTPDLNLKKVEGLASLSLLVLYEGPESKILVEPIILSHLQDNIALADLHDPEHAFLIIIITNISEAEGIAGWVRDQAGVKMVRLDIEQDRMELFRWFDKLMGDSLLSGKQKKGTDS